MIKKLAQALIGKRTNFSKKYTNQEIANLSIDIRKSIIEMLFEAGSGHPAGALGMAEVFTTLYFSVLKHNPKKPGWEGRDRLILSNGHICPVLYATLAEAKYFPKSELKTLRKINSKLQGHPHYASLPGIENTSGPLGQGLSQAIGVALDFKMDQKTNRVYCVMSDGELQEGQNWEAFMFAGTKQLINLTVLIDRNKIQLTDYTKNILPLEPLEDKLSSFGWSVIQIDGNNVDEILNACSQTKKNKNNPTAIICNTVPGKGVSFMENLPKWHGKAPNQQETDMAIKELNQAKI